MKYLISSTALIRSPAQSFDEYLNVFANDTYGAISPIVEESIAVASLDLSSMLSKGKLSTKQTDAVNKYRIRGAARSTPFGLFAGVGCIEFGATTSTKREDTTKSQKLCRVDYEWYYRLIDYLEHNDNILSNTRLIYNDQCYFCGEWLVNPYYNSFEAIQTGNISYSSIRIKNNDQLQFVCSRAHTYIKLQDLINEVKNRFTKLTDSAIISFVHALIHYEILLTELRQPITEKDPLENLISIMDQYSLDESNKNLLNQLVKIDVLRKKYETTQIGQGLDAYKELCVLMQQIFHSSNCLNVTLSIPIRAGSTINTSVKENLELYMDMLFNAFAFEENESEFLLKFKQDFCEKYGEYSEVPLLEVLDSSLGIGDPYSAKGLSPKVVNIEKLSNATQFIHGLCLRAIKNGNRSVLLSDRDLQHIRTIMNRSCKLRFAESLELNISILAPKSDDIDIGNYLLQLAPCPGSNGVGKLVNRFYNVLDKKSCLEIERMYSMAKKNSPYLITDSSYYCKRARTNNICSCKKNYEASVDAGIITAANQKRIPLNDLVIGFCQEFDRLYIRSKSNDEILKVNADSGLVSEIDNSYIRIIREISVAYEIHPVNCLRTIIQSLDLKYCPEIRYNKLILSNETWTVTEHDIALNDIVHFEKSLFSFAKDWNMPNIVRLIENDNYLLLDLRTSPGIRLLFSACKRIISLGQHIKLERGNYEDCLWLTDDLDHRYFSELTLECVLATTENNQKPIYAFPVIMGDTKSNCALNKLASRSALTRECQIGDDGWLYIKIYVARNRADEFVGHAMYQFVDRLLGEKLINKFFYIRYADPSFHIRLRIRACPEINISLLFEKTVLWINSVKGVIIKKYTLDIYSREVERYGGVSAFPAVEDVFFYDSLLTMYSIGQNREKSEGYNKQALVYVYDLIHCFLKDQAQEEKFTEQLVGRNAYRDLFREKRTEIINLVNGTEFQVDCEIEDYLLKRRNAIHEYVRVLNNLDEHGKLTNSRWCILKSLIHMCCNRISWDQELESTILSLIHHSLHAKNAAAKNTKPLEVK